MLVAAEQAGLSARDLMANAGLSPADLEDRDAPVDIHRHLHMVREIVSRQPGLNTGLRTGMTATVARFGVLGYVLRYATNLHRALTDYVRFQRLVTDVTTWSIERDSIYRLRLTVHPYLEPIPSAAEVQLATIISVSRQLTKTHLVANQVSFCHQPNGDPREHEQFFGCPVIFGAERYEIQLAPDVMELPIESADELSHQRFLHFAEGVLSKNTGLQATSEAVRQYVTKNLHQGSPRREQVAHAFGKTARTLLRHLEQEGQTFEQILDDSRRELALAYAADNRLAAFEIAGLLGYTEPSAFFRAFRRWTGNSPQQYRRRPAAVLTRVG
jgi:AraC-like DNA-binding protein